MRRLLTLVGIVFVFYLGNLVFTSQGGFQSGRQLPADAEFQTAVQDGLPDFPTPIVASYGRGRTRWTVSIPPNHDFPLSIDEYSRMSGHCREVSARARDFHQKTPLSEQAMLSHDAPDDYFVDVDQAERTGLLPSPSRRRPARDVGHFVGLDGTAAASRPVCESSMTFVLESPDAGLGNTLMLLWTFYGLAKSEGRAFFIDDSRWAYGPYADIFKPPPVPKCRPPPRHHMVPCPFQAKHLAVSSVTAYEVFPSLLAKHLRTSGAADGSRDLLDLARTGYRILSMLNRDDQAYVDGRIAELQREASSGDVFGPRAPVIGLHIRHGDQHPLEYQYKDTYMPAEVFLDTVGNLVDAYYDAARDDGERAFVTVIASDDPTVHQEPVFAHAFMAQERIRLASKEAIQEANSDRYVLHQFVDEIFGWEGGFFAPMFWNLGVQSKNNAANAPLGVEIEDVDGEARFTAPPSEDTLRLRSYLGRAYMMDLAVLAGASDNVVCTVSSMGCRLLAVMMGWESAIKKGHWVNIDGNYGWTGVNW